MNATFTLIELRRVLRDYVSMFFIAVLPAFFFLIFGAVQQYAEMPIGDSNVAFYTMVAMAAYGAVTATTGVGGMAAVERMQGWGRQLGLTPLSDSGYVAMKAVVAVIIAVIPITLIFFLGAVTKAKAPWHVWVISALIVLGGAGVFSLYGLAMGLAFRTEAAIGAASGGLVILAFLGNVFFPLSGVMLAIARFTPLYGVVSLARYPITEGYSIDAQGNQLPAEPIWVPLLNLGVWAIIFATCAFLLVRRGRGRQ